MKWFFNTLHMVLHCELFTRKQYSIQNYSFQVVGRELYNLVMTIVKNHEMSRRYENIVDRYTVRLINWLID